MPVISLADGQQAGKVKGVVLDPEGLRVAGLVVDQKGWFKDQRVIPYDQIESVGDHAVTVAGNDSIKKSSNYPELFELLKKQPQLKGVQVVTQEGTVLGVVEDYLFDPVTGQVTTLELAGGLLSSLWRGKSSLPAQVVKTVGRDAVIVDTKALQNLEEKEGPFREAVETAKDTKNRMWQKAQETSQEVSGTIQKSYRRLNVHFRSEPKAEQPGDEERPRDEEPPSGK